MRDMSKYMRNKRIVMYIDGYKTYTISIQIEMLTEQK